nr:MAG TPA: hypothetical protein [Caudoviricetes sp.]
MGLLSSQYVPLKPIEVFIKNRNRQLVILSEF